MADKLTKLISKALNNAQKDMPPAQNWNLHSEGGCDMLAAKVVKELKNEAEKDNSLYLELY